MKQKTGAALQTLELLGLPVHKKRGRPCSGVALSVADRVRRHREKLNLDRLAAVGEFSASSVESLIADLRSCFLRTEAGTLRLGHEDDAKKAWIALGARMGWM